MLSLCVYNNLYGLNYAEKFKFNAMILNFPLKAVDALHCDWKTLNKAYKREQKMDRFGLLIFLCLSRIYLVVVVVVVVVVVFSAKTVPTNWSSFWSCNILKPSPPLAR